MSQMLVQKVKQRELLKFPIGPFLFDPESSMKTEISRIKSLPERLEKLLSDISKEQLNWRYRPNGWELCQVVHHIADSHLNAYLRMRIAYTHSGESITPYDEKAWSELPDSKSVDISNSLKIIFSIHQRWVTFLDHLEENELENTYYHPGDQEHVTLRKATQMYAWHGDHHYAHLKQGLASNGKYKLI